MRKSPAAKHSKEQDESGEASERSLWKGSISFGLVQIPVSIATAERANELSFHQLDRHDKSPIGYERINKTTGKKVAWGDIVKGYEITKGQFVIVTDEDFAAANVAATQTIDIQDFVEAKEIPPAYFDRPYHLLPEGKSPKAYAVLRDAMAKKKLVAIALVVIRTRQHLCAVIPRGDGLELELLRFAHELKDVPSRRASNAPKATPKEVALAEQLIGSMVGRWDPAKYKDTYREDLLAALKTKAKTGTIEPHNVKPAAAGKATDLLALLQKSVASANKGPNKAPPAKAPKTKREAA